MLITTFEQWAKLPQNRNRRPADIYNEWLLEEQKLLMLYNQISLWEQWNQFNNAYGAANSGSASGSVPPPVVSYFDYVGSDSYMDPYGPGGGSTYFI